MLKDIYCQNCGSPLSGQWATCGRCGATILDSNKDHETQQQTSNGPRLRPCPDCQHSCSVSATSCPNCGYPFDANPRRIDDRPGSPQIGFVKKGSRTRRPLILAVLGLALVGAVATLGYLFYARRTVETEVRGEVFIVTKGAQNIKLGLVEIVAIPEEKIERFIEGKVATINVEYNKYKSLEQGTSSQVNEAQQALDESRAKFDALTTQLLAARGTAEKVREDAASLYASPSYSSSEEVAAYQSALSRAEALKQKADQIAAQLETASSDVDSKRTSLSSARSASAGQLKKVINLLSEEQLFQGVPWEGPKATTNSDGQFSMKLVSNKRYVIAAKARRHVFDSTEQYYWLVWVSLQGEQPMRVMLTNNNLMGTDSADAVFKPKDLIPTGITEH